MKQKIIKCIALFLGVILICTIVSRSIYNYLLPIVRTTKVQEGSVQVQYIAAGKVGLDEEILKNSQVILVPSMSGKVVEVSKQEGEAIQKGENLCVIQKSEPLESKQAKEIEQTQLILEDEGLEREVTSQTLAYNTLKSDYDKKLAEQEGITSDYTILSLQEEITVQRRSLELTTSLWQEGLASEQEYVTAQTKLEQLQRSLEEKKQAKQNEINEALDNLKKQMDAIDLSLAKLQDERLLNAKKRNLSEQVTGDEVLASPIAGYVYSLNVASGAVVSQNEKLAVIVSDEVPYNLSFEVEELVAGKLQMGQEVTFSYGRIPYKAKILKKKFNEATGLIKISCEIAADTLAQLNLERGSYKVVDVRITNESNNYPMLIENSALKKVYGNYSIFVIEENGGIGGSTYKAKEIAVTVLDEGDYKSAISGSVDGSMKVINSNIGELVDGQEVRLQ